MYVVKSNMSKGLPACIEVNSKLNFYLITMHKFISYKKKVIGDKNSYISSR